MNFKRIFRIFDSRSPKQMKYENAFRSFNDSDYNFYGALFCFLSAKFLENRRDRTSESSAPAYNTKIGPNKITLKFSKNKENAQLQINNWYSDWVPAKNVNELIEQVILAEKRQYIDGDSSVVVEHSKGYTKEASEISKRSSELELPNSLLKTLRNDPLFKQGTRQIYSEPTFLLREKTNNVESSDYIKFGNYFLRKNTKRYILDDIEGVNDLRRGLSKAFEVDPDFYNYVKDVYDSRYGELYFIVYKDSLYFIDINERFDKCVKKYQNEKQQQSW